MPPYLADPNHPHHELWLEDPDAAAALAAEEDSAEEAEEKAPAKKVAKKASK